MRRAMQSAKQANQFDLAEFNDEFNAAKDEIFQCKNGMRNILSARNNEAYKSLDNEYDEEYFSAGIP